MLSFHNCKLVLFFPLTFIVCSEFTFGLLVLLQTRKLTFIVCSEFTFGLLVLLQTRKLYHENWKTNSHSWTSDLCDLVENVLSIKKSKIWFLCFWDQSYFSEHLLIFEIFLPALLCEMKQVGLNGIICAGTPFYIYTSTVFQNWPGIPCKNNTVNHLKSTRICYLKKKLVIQSLIYSAKQLICCCLSFIPYR